MDGMMSWMGLWWLIGAVLLVALVAGGVYLGVRADRERAEREGLQRSESARAVLDRRLAAGEISVEEYYERESALRGSRS
jgi:uncharacterized membrane protein